MAVKSVGRQSPLVAVVDLAIADLPTGVAVKAVRLPPGAVVTGGGIRVVAASNAGTTDVLDVGDSASGAAYVNDANAKTLDLYTALGLKLGHKYASGDDITVTRTEAGTAATVGTFRLTVEYVIAERVTEVQTG